MSWPQTRLGDVCEIVSGATPKTGTPAYWDGDIAWATPKDLSDNDGKYLYDTPRKITADGFRSCSLKMLPAGSILLSSRAPIGLVAINRMPVCTNQGFKNLVPRKTSVSSDYLYWWLRCNRTRVEQAGRGATFKEISKAIVESLEIPLPPLAEQKRIAGILDAADALRAKRREAIAQLDALLQSTFLDMFGNPATNPMGWEECTVGDVTGCIVPGRDKPKSFTGTTPWITTDDLMDLAVTSHSPKVIGLSEQEIDEVRARVIPKGSVIISCVGDLGISSIAGCDLVVNQQLHTFQCGERINSQFLTFCLPFQKPWMKRRATQTTLPYLNKTNCNSIPIIVPPLDLQRRFATIVETVEQQKARMRSHLAELHALFASLQSRAFKGEI
ncbi:EcoKI restriction-modification system protein HsdS [Polystyrenella longa]|uniref:EcoKI restriction-modification system protein HsdS n=1 Tax=Polystyrenella longa TaxID=2528007 RepID=A0A518CTR6_9PLAN|nr:restriction endonuclease subunit S [Polystyrenella longa]QDU82620.1 EcoKI restriction-modification system protein HsdS [Polystyrenella longa]